MARIHSSIAQQSRILPPYPISIYGLSHVPHQKRLWHNLVIYAANQLSMIGAMHMFQIYRRALQLILLMTLAIPCWAQQENGSKAMEAQPIVIAADSFATRPSRVSVAANPELEGNGFKKMMLGKNYRKEWTTPVNVPVLYLSTAHLKPTKEGGGKQTRSLKIEDKDGNEYSLRSIRKYPEKAIPDELKNSLAEKIVSDGISASYPYGGISVAVFATAAGVPYLSRKIVFLADDPGLGEFRAKYKNALVLMEESKPSGNLPEAFRSKEKIETLDTDELILKLQATNRNKVDQMAVLRARLLDNFVMDFDRHEGQWNWASLDSNGASTFYVIPKDGDQVFFTNQGLVPKIAKGPIPEIQGFRANAKDQVTFNRPAINFDNFFLNSLNESQWRAEIDSFLASMTDSVIKSALKLQPAEIQPYAVSKIVKSLKKKRKFFLADMMKYYRHLAEVVSIVGSNEDESFRILYESDGKMLVTVTDKLGNGIYERVFDPNDTKEIRLYGLEGNDHFQIDGGKSEIKVRVIGGPGGDKILNNSNDGKIWVYDVDVEDNTISGSQDVKNRISEDPMSNEFKRLGYIFDKAGFGIYSECGFDGGIYVGARYRIIKHGFRKEPFATKHDFILGHELALNSFLFRYNADLIKVFGNTDLLIRAEYYKPTARTNFFGLGNESVYDKSNSIQYYRARYEFANLSVLARTRLNSWIDFRYGPTIQYFQLKQKENEGRLITSLDHNINDKEQLHQSFLYAGGELQFNVTTKNNAMMPTRGADINTTVRSLFNLDGSAGNLTQLSSTVSLYSDFLSRDHLVLATRFGFNHNIGEYQYAQANYLGFRENLRGFRLHRFAGATSAYNNLELRWKMTELKTFLCPITFGLLAFNDVGRVWVENENSSSWHDGYGGGIWIAPINKIVITGTLSYSSEEKNFPWITIGYQF